jgi:hypothetical protein
MDNEPQISLQHITLALAVIDICSKRGVFRGEELSSIGKLRDDFAAFVEHNAPKEEMTDESKETTQGAEATEGTSIE